MRRNLRVLLAVFAAAALALPAEGSNRGAKLVFEISESVGIGPTPGQRLGTSVAWVGDSDRDDKDDFTIGSPNYSTPGSQDAGAYVVYSGATGLLIWGASGIAGDRTGQSVAGAGDVNRDGFPDVVVGAPGSNLGGAYQGGAVFVQSRVESAAGSSIPVLMNIRGTEAGAQLGWSVSGAGDVNGDGRDDIIAGTPFSSPGGVSQAGSAFVYAHAPGTTTGAVLLYRIDGAAAGDELGFSVAGGRDIDHDGFADLIVGAPLASPAGLPAAGKVYVYSGATGQVLYALDGPAQAGQMGSSVAGGADLDGDGFEDIVAGAPFAYGTGAVFVFSGADGGLILEMRGEETDGRFGTSVSVGGDIDGDGVRDLFVGDPHGDPVMQTNDAGSAFAFSGRTGALLFRINGSNPGDALGTSVAGGGDLNGDGRSETLTGAPLADPNRAADAGVALVHTFQPRRRPR